MTVQPQPGGIHADTTWAPWSRDDPRGLGRYVTREAARWVRLPDDPVDLAQDPDSYRRRLVAAIYQGLVDRGIRYDHEEYVPTEGLQSIRTPAEVLSGARRGTCLDLATLFCGVCLGYDLLPVLVVLDGHALALVSLTHDLADWDAQAREEQHTLFADAPLRDPALLRELVDRGAYLAVECTGFASTAHLPDDLPEGSGREGLLLPFDRALAAGREQLDRPDRPLRFAIDVATAWQDWRQLPRWIGRHRTLRLGDGRRLELTEHGASLTPDDQASGVWALPTPLRPVLRPHPGFLDRQRERELAHTRVTQGAVLQFHGRTGVGRTALLRQLAHGELANAFPDGTVYLRAEDQPLDDLLQDLFTAFYASNRPYRPTRSELGRQLGTRQALVLVDDARLRAAELETLRDTMPQSAAVLTSGQPVGGAGTSVAVAGLPVSDAVTLVARQFGRGLLDDERDAAVQLATTLQGHPGSLLLAAAHAHDTGVGLPELARRLAVADTPQQLLAADVLQPLTDLDRAILSLLAGLNGAPLALEHLRGIIEDPEVARSVARLKRQGLLQADQPDAALPEWLAVPL